MAICSNPSEPNPDRSLISLLREAPVASDLDLVRSKREPWLAGLEAADANCIRETLSRSPHAQTLIDSIIEHSPYLWDLITADPRRLIEILRSDPASYLNEKLEAASRTILLSENDDQAMHVLRRLKSDCILVIALTDIGGVWPIERVMRALSKLADCCIQVAVDVSVSEAARRGAVSVEDAANYAEGSGYYVLAMGKLGAHELNFSSDVDLIVFFDPSGFWLAANLSQTAVRITRMLVKLLQERTQDGYVFRVDLRLRPDPASTQIAISTPAALDYYEHRGQNWERAAMIKARVCAGDRIAGNRLLSDIAPFVWRKYLDFAALADVHAMKRQIQAYRGHGEIAVLGHNIKLGRGGIREIEFFVQTQQLVAGGRNPVLRERGTLKALEILRDGGWIDEKTCTDLTQAYLFLRKVEHRLQMVNDEQTHILPDNAEDLQRFVHFCGFTNCEAFTNELLRHMRNVQAHYARLFEKSATENSHNLKFPAHENDRETLDKLLAQGFEKPLEVSEKIRVWLSGAPPALRGEFARAQLSELLPDLIAQFANAESPDQAVFAFDRFLFALHGGATLFALLRQNPELLSLICLTIGVAPRLADILALHPHVIDGLLDPSFFGDLPDMKTLAARLNDSLRNSGDDEEMLDRLRMFGQEQMFLVGTRILSGTISAQQAGEAFARLADIIIRALHSEVERRFVTAHGRISGQATALIAMGKLGGLEMTAGSDLDLILIYDFDAARADSDGPRALHGAQYFARFTQRFISALTAPTNYGALYQVDMRLRPSGRSGPVATRIDSFESYQRDEAWTWEHMALTRARVVSSTGDFSARVETIARDVLRRERDPQAIQADAAEMRQALATEKGEANVWDLKYAAGGTIDIEFIAQVLQLIHAADNPAILDMNTVRVLENAARLGLLAEEDSEVLRRAARLYHDLGQILRLCLNGPFDPKTASNGLRALLLRAADVPDFPTLEATLIELQARVRGSFTRIVGGGR